MTLAMFGSAPPSGVEMLTAWLAPLAALQSPVVTVAGERKADDPLPFWLVTKIPGSDDKVTEYATYSVSSIVTGSLATAEDLSWLAHRRIEALGPPLAPQQPVTISGGRIVKADWVHADQTPHYEYYSDTVRRFVARYDIDLRFIAV